MATTYLEPGTDATQDFSLFLSTQVSGTGAISSDTSRPNTGPRSIKSSPGSGGTAQASTPDGVLADAGTQIGWWINLDALPAALGVFMDFRDSSALSVCSLRMNTTGTARVAPNGATAVDGTFQMAINKWYWLVLSYYITNTTTFQFKLYVHDAGGTLQDTITANAGTLNRAGSSRVVVGVGTVAWGANNVWYDDLYVATGGASSGSQPDLATPIRVTAKRPNANGTTNGFTTQIGSGGSGYGTGHSPQVNERPLSQTNGWSQIGAGSAVTEEYNVENVSTGDVNVTGLPLVDWGAWIMASALLSETGQIIVGGVTSNVSLTSSPTVFSAFAGSTVYPAGSGADVGIVTATTVTTVSLYECGVLEAFTLITGGLLVKN